MCILNLLFSFSQGGADEEAVCQYLLRFKVSTVFASSVIHYFRSFAQHLSSTILPAVAGQQADTQAVSDIDFYIDQVKHIMASVSVI